VTSHDPPDGEHHPHRGDHVLTAGCPLGCLAGQLSAPAFNPLSRELPWLLDRPVTVADVTRMYLRGQLHHIRHLGPRRIGEVSLVLNLAGLTAPPPRAARPPPAPTTRS